MATFLLFCINTAKVPAAVYFLGQMCMGVLPHAIGRLTMHHAR